MNADTIIKLITMFTQAAPEMINIVNHYKEMADKDFDEMDKKKIKENLESLKMKGWDEL